MAKEFAYSPLNGPREIRIFSFHLSFKERTRISLCSKLSCSESLPRISGRLNSIRLDDPRRQPFFALSYTWGSPFLPSLSPETSNLGTPHRYITCNGRKTGAQKNLHDVLSVMRNLKLPHPIWIDALCINQQDAKELSTQVSVMGDRYSIAERVIVWLGPHDLSSRTAIQVMERLELAFANLHPEQRPRGQFKFGDHALFSMIKTEPITTNEWLAIADFFSRTWFHRIWTTQEVALSQNLTFLCGDSIISKDTITGFAKWVCNLHWDQALDGLRKDRESHPVCGIDVFCHTSQLIFQMRTGLENPETTALLKLLFGASTQKQMFVGFVGLMLIQNQHRLASNPRDRVFAPLALAKMVTKDQRLVAGLPTVEYGNTVEKIYSGITAYIITNLGNLSFLSFVDRDEEGLLQLPSWTPNFNAACKYRPLLDLGYNAILSWNTSICTLTTRCHLSRMLTHV